MSLLKNKKEKNNIDKDIKVLESEIKKDEIGFITEILCKKKWSFYIERNEKILFEELANRFNYNEVIHYVKTADNQEFIIYFLNSKRNRIVYSFTNKEAIKEIISKKFYFFTFS